MADENTPDPAAGGTTDPAPPWHTGIIDPTTGGLVPDWFAKAPEEERAEWEAHKEAKTPWDVVNAERERRKEAQTALRNKQAAASGLPVKPEGDKATPEAWAEYRKAHGLPVDPKEYGITRPDDFPAELWNEKETEDFQKFALEAELKPEQVKALAAWYQARGKEAFAAHQTAVAAQKALEEKARADYIQAQKETLHQNHGVNVDRDLKLVGKLTAAAGLDPEALNPDNPDKFVGADVVKALVSLVAMIPKSGDPTARMMGRAGAPEGKDRAYWQDRARSEEDWKILANPSHPQHAATVAAKNAAYAQDAALREAQ